MAHYINETDILAVIGEDGPRCVEHAISDYFDGDQERFRLVDTGDDLNFRDAHGDVFCLVHVDSVQYAQSSEDFYPDGLYCMHKWNGDTCGAELVGKHPLPDEVLCHYCQKWGERNDAILVGGSVDGDMWWCGCEEGKQ